MRSWAALAVVLAPPLCAASAQSLVSDCNNGAPAIPPNVGADTSASELLNRLSWRNSSGNYALLVSLVGPLATLDSIAKRGSALLAISGDLRDYAAQRIALDQRMAGLHRDMMALTAAEIDAGDVPNHSALSITTTTVDSVVDFVKDSVGNRMTLIFKKANPVPAIALCAIVRTTTNYLDFLAKPEFKRIADNYARAVRHWNAYIEQGYSMTLIERLGNSCRLGPLNWIVAPTVASQCRQEPWKTLGPPSVRVIFVHPSAGLAPVFDSSSTVRVTSITEWYGLLWTPFWDDRIMPLGVSIASMFPQTGRPKIGGVVHTPVGKVGMFRSGKTVNERRGRIVIMADLIGWVPGNRAQTGKQLWDLLARKQPPIEK